MLNLDALDLVIDSASISFSVAPSPVSFFRPVDVELEDDGDRLNIVFVNLEPYLSNCSAVMIEAAEAGRTWQWHSSWRRKQRGAFLSGINLLSRVQEDMGMVQFATVEATR
uniref:Uncharacterized protein n=1 Tax=Ananas comosus var. bracteatus TaxID=296719 RepID=A0A6V7QN17_ANACO|nr:unnamed protein product [Ananas comosus var. bracteatus]